MESFCGQKLSHSATINCLLAGQLRLVAGCLKRPRRSAQTRGLVPDRAIPVARLRRTTGCEAETPIGSESRRRTCHDVQMRRDVDALIYVDSPVLAARAVGRRARGSVMDEAETVDSPLVPADSRARPGCMRVGSASESARGRRAAECRAVRRETPGGRARPHIDMSRAPACRSASNRSCSRDTRCSQRAWPLHICRA